MANPLFGGGGGDGGEETYLIIFDGLRTHREDLIEALSRAPQVLDWIVALPHAFLVKSTLNEQALYAAIRTAHPGIEQLMVTTVSPAAGRLYLFASDFITDTTDVYNDKHKRREYALPQWFNRMDLRGRGLR